MWIVKRDFVDLPWLLLVWEDWFMGQFLGVDGNKAARGVTHRYSFVKLSPSCRLGANR